jgi:hypothetical protein
MPLKVGRARVIHRGLGAQSGATRRIGRSRRLSWLHEIKPPFNSVEAVRHISRPRLQRSEPSLDGNEPALDAW